MPPPAAKMPPPDDNDTYPYSFDDAPQQAQPVLVRRKRRRQEDEDETLGEEILDAVTDRIDLPIPGWGCLWGVLTLPFRLIGKLFDLFD